MTRVIGGANATGMRALRGANAAVIFTQVSRVVCLMKCTRARTPAGYAHSDTPWVEWSGGQRFVAVLEDWHLICSVVVAAGSISMIGIMLYNNLQQ